MENQNNSPFALQCPMPLAEYEHVLLAHGGGGKLTQQLIDRLFLPQFHNPLLEQLHDGAVFELEGTRLAFTTDSYVISPIFFPGGDIGALAVYGTVNDLAMCGAVPMYLSIGMIMEEGLPMEELRTIVQSIQQASARSGVSIITGDTKVVERGKADRLFINTSGVGIVRPNVNVAPGRARPGDAVLLSGPIGLHGISILSVREGLQFESPVLSDSAPLHTLTQRILDVCPDTHVLRDPTRGGLASALNEIARSSNTGITLTESAIPIPDEVSGACEILGLDPLYVANEGVLLAIVPDDSANAVLAAMKEESTGYASCRIGEVVAGHPGIVTMKTRIGATRVVDMLSGEQLPRIC